MKNNLKGRISNKKAVNRGLILRSSMETIEAICEKIRGVSR